MWFIGRLNEIGSGSSALILAWLHILVSAVNIQQGKMNRRVLLKKEIHYGEYMS